MSDWDDEDFEPEVKGLAPPPEEEDVPPPALPPPNPPKPKSKAKQKEGKAFNMEDLGRELTPKEREEIQRRHDMAFARELFGAGDDDEEFNSYQNIMTQEEFETWGDKVGRFLANRHKAAHFGSFLNKLLPLLVEPLESAEVRKVSNLLKQIADDKKTAEDKNKKSGAVKGKGPTKKPTMKAAGGKGRNDMMDDYGGGGNYDEYDDFM